MKHIAIVAPHFVPSNLTAVHRARLLATHLPEFGWQPTIVTVNERYYEETLEPELYSLLPSELKIRKARAFSTRPIRWVGDIGIRGFWGLYQEIHRLHKEQKIDFLYITIPSNFAAPLGRLILRSLKIPYGIDYIDPWVHEWPGTEKVFSKAWLSFHLSKILEPFSVEKASLITGISPSYYEGVLSRNPHLKDKIITVAMPYGWTETDYDYVKTHPRKTFVFDAHDNKFHLVYAGAMLPKAYELLEILFAAIRSLLENDPEFMKDFNLHFIGTGRSADDPKEANIRPFIEKYHLNNNVYEYPQRIGYIDVLNHLLSASGVLVLGSSEKHYSPSKIFQALLSTKPVFAILHEESSAINFLKQINEVQVVTFGEGHLPESAQLAASLRNMINGSGNSNEITWWNVIEGFSARNSGRVLANALDRVYSRKSL